MELVDILKITVPIILFMIAGMGGALKWIFMREESRKAQEAKSQKEYWGTVNDNLQNLVSQLASQVRENKGEFSTARERMEARISDVDKRLQEFREEVAGEYIKRDSWLEHAVSLERKVDELRNDINREIKDLIRVVSSRGTTNGTQ
ncbi:hypothetical protein [Pseudohongiella acticola]|uniref:hypothetical protein n=1 Tax=Pseudohongiella acticola TaxID=1524254 RepID=UPI0030EC2344